MFGFIKEPPKEPGVYPVTVPEVEETVWAKWTGEYWTCWALTPEMAETLEIRGPERGYWWT